MLSIRPLTLPGLRSSQQLLLALQFHGLSRDDDKNPRKLSKTRTKKKKNYIDVENDNAHTHTTHTHIYI